MSLHARLDCGDMQPASAPSNLADYAYGILRDRLVMLDIVPGSPINESALAAELNVGRTPLREALKRLQGDHLVAFFPRRGTFATSADLGELKGITEMRLLLEPAGTYKAAESATAEQRDRLLSLAQDIAGLMDSNPSARTLTEYDLMVHRAIYELIDNAHMRETLFRLGNLASRLWWAVIQQMPSVAEHIAGHRALLQAVADGDPVQAAELARDHVSEFHQQLQASVIGAEGMATPPALRAEPLGLHRAVGAAQEPMKDS